MRTLTAQEAVVLGKYARSDFIRVSIRDSDGTWRTDRALWTGAPDSSWLMSAEWGRSSDAPIGTATVNIWLTEFYRSTSPFFEGSQINRNAAGAFSPLVDLNRGLRIETATAPQGYEPAAADWRLVFDGYIQACPTQGDVLAITARGNLGRLQRKKINTERKYGSAVGVLAETIAASILSDNSLGSTTLWVPTASGWLIDREFTVPKGNVYDALQTIFRKRGWAVRERYRESASEWQATLMRPDYENVTVHHTFNARDVLAIPSHSPGDLDQVANSGVLSYRDSATGDRLTVSAQDATSITAYEEAYFEVAEPDDSPIDSAAEAEEYLDGILQNLSLPETAF
ncbi:MAG TPA: hypothetical protein VNP72_09950, partial [Longimicrobium sp.]|nr:hypothetical protein [Longimicrobium sp.]